MRVASAVVVILVVAAAPGGAMADSAVSAGTIQLLDTGTASRSSEYLGFVRTSKTAYWGKSYCSGFDVPSEGQIQALVKALINKLKVGLLYRTNTPGVNITVNCLTGFQIYPP